MHLMRWVKGLGLRPGLYGHTWTRSHGRWWSCWGDVMRRVIGSVCPGALESGWRLVLTKITMGAVIGLTECLLRVFTDSAPL